MRSIFKNAVSKTLIRTVASTAAALMIVSLPASSQSEPSKGLAIAILVGDLGNPFFVEIGRSIEKKAREVAGNNIRVAVSSSGYDVDRQIFQINNFVTEGYDVLFLSAADTNKVAASVKGAADHGKVVVAVDVKADGAQATVTSDNVDAGQQACSFMAQQLGGSGSIVILNGPPVSSVLDRVVGCKTALRGHPGIKILSDDQNAGASFAGGLASMSTLLAQYGRIDAVFANNDPSAMGADFAAKQAGRRDFFIVSVDASPEGVRLMETKDSLLTATVAQDPQMMADRAFSIGYDLFQGKKPAIDKDVIPVHLVTKENAALFRTWVR